MKSKQDLESETQIVNYVCGLLDNTIINNNLNIILTQS